MLRLSRELQDKIEAHGKATYPYEGCGLLLGRAENGENIVKALFSVVNRWEDQEEKRVRFRISGEDMLKAELAAAEKELDVVGVFHSHPDHPPIASQRDLAWAAWPGYSYLITEVRQGRPAGSRSWQLRGDRSGFVEEKLEIS